MAKRKPIKKLPKKKVAKKKSSGKTAPEPSAETAPKPLTLKQRAIITANARLGNITEACRCAGVQRDMHYKALRASPLYAQTFQESEQQFVDRIRQRARHVALDGTQEFVFSKGIQCMLIRTGKDGAALKNKDGSLKLFPYVKTSYATHILAKMMESRCPEYAQKATVDLTSGGKPLAAHTEQRVKTDELLNNLDSFIEKAVIEKLRGK